MTGGAHLQPKATEAWLGTTRAVPTLACILLVSCPLSLACALLRPHASLAVRARLAHGAQVVARWQRPAIARQRHAWQVCCIHTWISSTRVIGGRAHTGIVNRLAPTDVRIAAWTWPPVWVVGAYQVHSNWVISHGKCCSHTLRSHVVQL